MMRTTPAVLAKAIGVVLLLIALLLGGCRGHAAIHRIPLAVKDIGPTQSIVEHINPRECYFWLDEQGRICVGIHHKRLFLIEGIASKEAWVSFVLDKPPAGETRTYRANRATMRWRGQSGLAHTRAASLAGIVGVWDWGGSTIHGRFLLSAKQQSYTAVAGWRGGRRILFVGDFTARRHPQKGRRILERTEEGSMARSVLQDKLKRSGSPE